ncbi:MAG: SCP2 sterol-binding domain-containing protein [Actinomycetota bacterium]
MDATAFNEAGSTLTSEEKDLLAQLLGGTTFRQIAEVQASDEGLGRTITFSPDRVQMELNTATDRAEVTISLEAELDPLFDDGNVTPAAAIADGRITIHGNASLLTEAQRLLTSLHARCS